MWRLCYSSNINDFIKIPVKFIINSDYLINQINYVECYRY